jgi:hypothetical protein
MRSRVACPLRVNVRTESTCLTWQGEVTDATAGIGRAVAARLAENGAEVVVHGRDERRGAELVSAERGGRARFVAADLTNARTSSGWRPRRGRWTSW